MPKFLFFISAIMFIITNAPATTITLQSYSGGYVDPICAAYLYVDGVDYSVNARGVNLLVLDEITGGVLDSRRYDTCASTANSDAMASYINSLASGRIVLAAVKDEATNCMTTAGLNALYSLGASDWQQGYRGSWALIGKVGLGRYNGTQAWHTQTNGPSIVTTTYDINTAPVTSMPSSYDFTYGQNLLLDASGSYDPDSGDTITNYAWDLNNDGVIDINTSEALLTLTQPEYSDYFPVHGTYVLGLKTTDNNGYTSDFVTSNLNLAIPELNTIGLFALSLLSLVFVKTKRS